MLINKISANISLWTCDIILFIFSIFYHCLPSFAVIRQVTILIAALIILVAFNYFSSLALLANNSSTLYMNYALYKANIKSLVPVGYYSTSSIIPKSSWKKDLQYPPPP